MKPEQKTVRPLRRLWQYGKAYRGRIWLATASSISNKLFDLAPPLLIGAAVDVVVSQEASFLARWGIVNISSQLWLIAILSVLAWGLESLFEYFFQVLWRNLAQSLQHDLRMDTYAHVQNLELAYFEDRSTGGLIAVLNDDVNQLERFLDVGANQIIQLITTAVSIGGLFIVTAPSVAWMAIVPMPFVVWGSAVFQKRLAPKYTAVRDQVGMLNGQLANNLGGIATIKSFTAEKYEEMRIRGESEKYQATNQQAIVLSSAFVPVIRMVIVSGFILIMVYGGQLAIRGVVNVGLYSVLVFMTQRLLWPLTNLGTMLDLYQRAMASTARVFSLLDTVPEIYDGDVEIPLSNVHGHILYDNVSFKYMGFHNDEAEDLPVIIDNLTLDIRAGETAAFVGPTGSGKSTIIKLLLRFYDVTNGRITLDGVDVRKLHRSTLRQAIGLVSQDVFLFHGTVYENIAYGRFDASYDEVVEAAKTAEAHEFIMRLPDGYDTIVGERGQKLSGGQRQRISIARAVLKDPPILILDEATSSVDNETEAAIQRSMERITVGRTTIVIAHRLSTIRNADKIFVLENGRLIENGQHDSLVMQNGVYASLWKVQTGER